ncbi:MAG: hypothetical protein AB7J30_11495 [Hyphomicrobium sp.]|uniref:hypothetical protein n=1 Tax=Hyphomicrobium sp. TaxID=82 RepID=UPI003D0C45D4
MQRMPARPARLWLARRAALAALLLPVLLANADRSRAGEPEFGGECLMGLAEGKRIKTTCKVTWSDSDGKTYCFSTEDAKANFLNDPATYLQKAKEHFAAAEVEGTASNMVHFTSDDAQAFTDAYIKAQSDKNGGVFQLNDAMLGQTLALKLVKIDFVRTLHGYGFFPDVLFAAADTPDKTYLVDFWVKPRNGKLELMDARVYKAPRKEGDKWVMMTRQPKPWWWIPASEHPGESEQKRGWEIMSAIDEHIVGERAKSAGLFKLKDEKTGEEIALEFVGIHQPVRRLKENGKYFACSDFRRAGSKDEYYDIDFWLDENDGKITVNAARMHKVPVLEDGNFIQMPRYTFDPNTFEVIP